MINILRFYLLADATRTPLMYNTLLGVLALDVIIMLLLKDGAEPAGV